MIDLEESSKKNLYYSLTGTILPEISHLQAAGLIHKRLDSYVEKRLSTQSPGLNSETTSCGSVQIFRELDIDTDVIPIFQ